MACQLDNIRFVVLRGLAENWPKFQGLDYVGRVAQHFLWLDSMQYIPVNHNLHSIENKQYVSTRDLPRAA